MVFDCAREESHTRRRSHGDNKEKALRTRLAKTIPPIDLYNLLTEEIDQTKDTRNSSLSGFFSDPVL